MTSKSVVKVKEWFFDKINDEMSRYGIMLIGEYAKDGNLDHTLLRVEEVLAETEKAYKVSLDAETRSGYSKSWTAWVPKSVIC